MTTSYARCPPKRPDLTQVRSLRGLMGPCGVWVLFLPFLLLWVLRVLRTRLIFGGAGAVGGCQDPHLALRDCAGYE